MCLWLELDFLFVGAVGGILGKMIFLEIIGIADQMTSNKEDELEKIDIRYVKAGSISRDTAIGIGDDPVKAQEWAEEELLCASDEELLEGLMDFDQASSPGQYFDGDSFEVECVELAEKNYEVVYESDLWKEYIGREDSLKEKCKSFAMGFYIAGTECDHGTWEELFESKDLIDDGFWMVEAFEGYSDDDIKNAIACLYKDLMVKFRREK